MGSFGFGANGGSAFTDRFVASSIAIPQGRIGSSGTGPIIVTAISMYFGGNGGTTNCYLYLGGAITATFGATSGVSLKGAAISAFFANGGSATAGIQPNPDFHSISFGRGGGGSTSDADGTSWAGTIGGVCSYAESAAAPSFTVTPNTDGDQATVVITAPGDNGGSALTGYRIQRATDAAFTLGLTTVNSTGTSVITGLVPGTVYHWRSTARNGVSDAASALGGPWAAAQTITQPDPAGLGRRFNGTTWDVNDGKRYNSVTGVWNQLDGRRYNSVTGVWDPLGH